jgi:hypothetical protein
MDPTDPDSDPDPQHWFHEIITIFETILPIFLRIYNFKSGLYVRVYLLVVLISFKYHTTLLCYLNVKFLFASLKIATNP